MGYHRGAFNSVRIQVSFRIAPIVVLVVLGLVFDTGYAIDPALTSIKLFRGDERMAVAAQF